MRVSFVSMVLLLISCGKGAEGIKPTLSSITESVYASGTIKASDQYTVFPMVNGVVQDIKVKPGDTVKQGDILFVLDKNTAGLTSEGSRLSLELSEALGSKSSDRLREAELRMKLAYDKYVLDSNLFMRQKRLWEQQIGTRLEFDQRRIALVSSRNAYQVAERQYKQEQLLLKNELERAKVNYDISKKLEDNFTVRSAISGKVFDVFPEKGELISTQTKLAVIGRPNNFLLELQVDENDVAEVRVGQQVEITMDSYRGQVFEGKVETIYPMMDEQTRTFRVDASFKNPPATLYPNLTVEANIIIRRKEKAIVIPRSYLDKNGTVRVGDEKRRVKTGLSDYQKIEITEGLDTSDIIYKPEE